MAAIKLGVAHIGGDLDIDCPWIACDLYGDEWGTERELNRSTTAIKEAEEHWQRVLRDQVPGLSVRPFPQVFMVKVYDWANGREGWIPAFVIPSEYILEGWKVDCRAGELLVNKNLLRAEVGEGWSYEAVLDKLGIAGIKADLFDMPNPRAYWLDGEKAVHSWHRSISIGPWIRAAFQKRLLELWNNDQHINDRNERLTDFLNHHRDKGGSSDRFKTYIGDLIAAPLKGFDALLWARLSAWLIGPMTKGHTPKENTPSQQVIARVHAYRFQTGDKSADINTMNANELAKTYGWSSPSSGRALRNLYNRFTQRMNAKAERIGHPSSAKAKGHMLETLKLLDDNPNAKNLADSEFAELIEKLGEDVG